MAYLHDWHYWAFDAALPQQPSFPSSAVRRPQVRGDRAKLKAALDKMFGTPAHPKVEAEGLDPDVIEKLRLQPAFLAEGSKLYRQHCLHCHGVTGDGNGPTAPFLWPRPRDYRPGKFKFTSTPGDKPTRDDLRKTILFGLHGTSMPAFESLMSGDDIEQVLDYIIFLSMRGETELGLIDEIVHAVPTEQILFESPQKDQQVWFVRRFGADVNIGNVQPEDVLALETIRLGLRSDTASTVYE